MNKVDFGHSENLVGSGLLPTFVAITLLTGTAIAEAAKTFFWMALAILFPEKYKFSSASTVNAAVAELKLTATMVVNGDRGLFSSLGKTFAECPSS